MVKYLNSDTPEVHEFKSLPIVVNINRYMWDKDKARSYSYSDAWRFACSTRQAK